MSNIRHLAVRMDEILVKPARINSDLCSHFMGGYPSIKAVPFSEKFRFIHLQTQGHLMQVFWGFHL